MYSPYHNGAVYGTPWQGIAPDVWSSSTNTTTPPPPLGCESFPKEVSESRGSKLDNRTFSLRRGVKCTENFFVPRNLLTHWLM